ncbi:ABC transporter [Kitasatospora sp. MMS16-BH015]|uniref:ABC transporter transmembrane domain-containing protein n=1 Tax=Kitasatospora sp. MMS16-BH015 TaxID=2018025 RepID=UPI000CA32335|nr:ABC transporter ATP-binding protein [Kitasatospora sp. MMS16-BH015]AUG81514.1 ABC transporter [Kitasatospora sp. MMS16-BH015]
MHDLSDDPGTPDIRSAARYLRWLTATQRRRVVTGALLSIIWMLMLTLQPYLLSRAVDDGLRAGRPRALVAWTAAILVAGLLNAGISMLRHRTMTRLRMDATFRTVRVVNRQSVRLGAALPRLVTSGEVVTIGIGDVGQIARTLTFVGPGIGSLVAIATVGVLLLTVSPLLAVVVLLGVPSMAVLVGPLLGRLRGVESRYRERQGRLAARFEDMVGGLRVLNGLGGKETYAERYRRDSQELRADGYRVGAVTSWLQSFGVGLPTLFLAAVTWLAARLAASGDITVGQLVAVYGYVAVLVFPVQFLVESGQDISRGLVAAARVVRFLSLDPGTRPGGAEAPAAPAALRDPASGVEVLPGRLTVLACARPQDAAAVVDRLGRFAATGAQRGTGGTWGTDPLDSFALAAVRDRILVADNEAALFAGPLREVLSGRHRPDDAALHAALAAAAALDVLRGLPDGLDTLIEADGRNLSGGQRQRLRLARALAADPEVLLAVEPTSAVDTHTEAAMVAGLRRARAGRTTLVTGVSPLLLDQADTVQYLVDGKVAATGSHRELLRDHPGYQALVARTEADSEVIDTEDAAVPNPRRAEEPVR